MKNIQHLLVVCFGLGLCVEAFAQPDLNSGQVEVIKNFDAQLLEANKLKLTPTLPPLDTVNQRLTYSIPTQSFAIDYPAPVIRPIAMKSEKVAETYRGYGKIGYGTPKSPYAELSYYRRVLENLDVGGHFKHHSANNSNTLDNQRFAETEAELEGTYYFLEQGFALGANIGFNDNNRYFYGYDHAVESFEKEEVHQRFKTFDFGLDFFNSEQTNGDINYFADMDFYGLSDRFATSESGALLQFGLSKYFAEKHPLSVVLKTDFTSYKDNESRKQSLNNFSLRPNFGYHADRFKVDVGANIISHNDEFTVYPDIEATVNILGTRLAVFAGWEGDFIKNTFQSLTNYNPYIVSNITVENTEYQTYYGGIKGNINLIEYHGKIGLKNANNIPLFLANEDDTKRFDIIYDNGQLFNIEGTINLNILKGLQLGGTLRSNVYTLDNQVKPWHLPSLETNVTARFKTLKDKLLIKGEWYVANGVPFVNEAGFADNLNALFDLSFGAEYWVNKNIGAFVDVNNLFGNKLERWQNYPGYGLNAKVGVTGRF